MKVQFYFVEAVTLRWSTKIVNVQLFVVKLHKILKNSVVEKGLSVETANRIMALADIADQLNPFRKRLPLVSTL